VLQNASHEQPESGNGEKIKSGENYVHDQFMAIMRTSLC